MSKRTFEERVKRTARKQADRDYQYRQEETLDSVVEEVSRLCDEINRLRDEALARLRNQREEDARALADLKAFVGPVPVDSDGKPLVTVRERLEQYEEQYRSLLDQARDHMAKVVAADGMAGLFQDLKQRVEAQGKRIIELEDETAALKKDLQSPPTDGDLFATASEVASLRERVRNIAEFVGYDREALGRPGFTSMREAVRKTNGRVDKLEFVGTYDPEAPDRRHDERLDELDAKVSKQDARIGEIESDVRARPVTNEDMGYEPEWAAKLKEQEAQLQKAVKDGQKILSELSIRICRVENDLRERKPWA